MTVVVPVMVIVMASLTITVMEQLHLSHTPSQSISFSLYSAHIHLLCMTLMNK